MSELARGTAPEAREISRVPVVSLGVTVTNLEAAARQVLDWSSQPIARRVHLSNVHMVMEAHDSPEFRAIVNSGDLVLADGMPLVWAQRLSGFHDAARVPGPQLSQAILDRAAALGVPVGFYGGSPRCVEVLVRVARERWPALRIAVAISPPFHPLTPDEDAAFTEQIARSGARILFVGIGCPKQERWMAEHADRLSCVMLGVGQAFDILAAVKRDAPRWMQALGLGWLFRLASEPRRLWKRYARHNPRFIALLLTQMIVRRRASAVP
jgi:N-acetylglucosaminyldiphosphoundecaprenol N-acetyl-beta-D-mannosaminyltransferase